MSPFISSISNSSIHGQVDLNNHGYQGNVTYNANDHVSIGGHASGDLHGHNQYGGSIEYHPNNIVTFGADVTVNPSVHQNTLGGHVEWKF